MVRQPHLPAVALENTGARTGILIHPGHPAHPGDPPFSFISSIGCFNLTEALEPADDIEYFVVTAYYTTNIKKGKELWKS